MVGIVDVHCHILPGVDDGPRESREAMEMLRMEFQQGVRRIICTPHLRKGMFETPMEERLERLDLMKKKLLRMGIPMELYLGCEFHVESEMLAKLKEEPGYAMAGSRYVLTEFPFQITEQEAMRYLRELISSGYRPVIAHVERYRKLHMPEAVQQFIQMGAYIQVNAGSLTGAEGWTAKHASRRLLEEGIVHFVGSDAHSTGRRKPCFDICTEYMRKKIGEDGMRRILIENPAKLINNEYI